MITLKVIFLAPYLIKQSSYFTYFSFELTHIIVGKRNRKTELLSFNLSCERKENSHATLVMSKLKEFHLTFLKVNLSVVCLEPGSFGWNVMPRQMPGKMIFIQLQTFIIQLLNIQIMKNFEILFEHFEAYLVIYLLGTRIIWIRYDVRINAKQNSFH